MNSNKRILLFASNSYAGMGPYVVSIVNSFKPEDNVFFFLVENSANYFRQNVKPDLLSKCHIELYRATRIKNLAELIFNSGYPYSKRVIDYVKSHNIEMIHCLTAPHDYRLIRKLINEDCKILYTVHDLEPHEADKAFYKVWWQNVLYRRIFRCMDISPAFITNGRHQFNVLKERYPDRQIFFGKFPTLITDKVANGMIEPPELKDVNDYILFFGRIEAYKGVELLIEAYLKSSIRNKCKLVIAGKGEINATVNDSQIILINRYIDDEEVASLYRNAAIVAYPYISATQSGVLSVASYFKKPMIVSDVPFFLEIIGDSGCAKRFQKGNVDSLANALNFFDFDKIAFMSKVSEELYNSLYASSTLREELMGIYDEVCNSITDRR